MARLLGTDFSKLEAKIRLFTNMNENERSITTEVNNIILDGSPIEETPLSEKSKILYEINLIRTEVETLYHEKQNSEMCGLHALYNALQYRMFTAADWILIADELQLQESQLYYDQASVESDIYRSNYGNFNSDVLILALEKKTSLLKDT